MSNTVEASPEAPAGEDTKVLTLEIKSLVDRVRQLRALYADEKHERTRLDVTARCFLVYITGAVFSQLGEDTHDEVVRALGFDHLARDMNTSRGKRAACAELLA